MTTMNRMEPEILLIGFGGLSNFAEETRRHFPRHFISVAPSAGQAPKQNRGTYRLIQPTYLLPGIEYDKMKSEIAAMPAARTHPGTVFVGKPLLQDSGTTTELADILSAEYKDRPTLFVGHGTAHTARAFYTAFHVALRERAPDTFVGVLSGTPDFETVCAEIQSREIREIRLVPLMMTAGKHVREEIIGNSEKSWRKRFEKKGIPTDCICRGLLDYPAVREMLYSSMQATMQATI